MAGIDTKMWLLLAPVAVIELGLIIFSLVKLIRSRQTKYLNKGVWAVIVVLGGFIGSIIYLVLESGQNDSD
ncbi:PLDc N-terminal domain-containing protein [Lactovum odontotermitis]